MLIKRKRFGEILVNRGKIDEDQLREALELRSEKSLRIGKVLVSLGFINESDIVDVLSEQLGIEKYDIDDVVVDESLFELVGEDFIKMHRFIPLSISEESFSVAVSDPLNIVLVDELRRSYRVGIELYLLSDIEIDSVINKFYDSTEEVLEDLEISGVEVGSSDEYDVDPNTSSAPIIKLVDSILRESVRMGASDIHISVNADDVDVRYRIDGILQEIRRYPKKVSMPMIARIKMMSDLDITEKRLPQDGSMRIKLLDRIVDLRVSTLPNIYGEKVVIRLLEKNEAIMKLDGLGFSDENMEVFKNLIRNPIGILLVTGPTGSGKSSTLYAAINELNTVDKNIITLEDPVEFKVKGITQVNVNDKIGLDFSSGLRSILRQDPDVILVGEIRDSETGEISIRASNTGHLVFSTLHTNSSASAVTRLIDMGVEPYLVASTVIGVLNQRLVRRVCSSCRESYVCSGVTKDKTFFGLGDGDVTLYRGAGCKNCNFTGYKGRVPIQEILVVSEDVSRAIVDGKSVKFIEDVAVGEGMKTLKFDGLQKALAGITTLEEVRRFVVD